MSRSDLDDERAFLLRSIEDLDKERAAGDLSESDHAVLRDRYVARAAQVLRSLDRAPRAGADDQTSDSQTSDDHTLGDTAWRRERTPEGPDAKDSADSPATRARRPARRRRTLLLAGGGALVAALCGVIVAVATQSRLPGETSSGSVTVSRAAQVRRMAAQADTLQSQGDVTGAAHLYRQVLAVDPNQPDALAQLGWLEFEAGVQARNGAVLARAQQLEQQAVRAAPGSYAAHLYLGSMLLAENDAVGAQKQYLSFLADHPPIAEVRTAARFIQQAFLATKTPPPELPG